MKINFEDGSFILFEDAEDNPEQLTITMCGLKDSRKRAIMSYSTFTQFQVAGIIDFLQNWLETKK